MTACRPCNARKAATPLGEFALTLGIAIRELAIHGDPVVDNADLPIQIRLLRREVMEAVRAAGRLTGRSAQKKIEQAYRSAFWATEEGQTHARSFPGLPGHVRTMIPEIQTIATSEREFWLLVKLAKSANTRSLIGSLFDGGGGLEARVRRQARLAKDDRLRRRLDWALARFERSMKRRGAALDE